VHATMSSSTRSSSSPAGCPSRRRLCPAQHGGLALFPSVRLGRVQAPSGRLGARRSCPQVRRRAVLRPALGRVDHACSSSPCRVGPCAWRRPLRRLPAFPRPPNRRVRRRPPATRAVECALLAPKKKSGGKKKETAAEGEGRVPTHTPDAAPTHARRQQG